MTKKQCPLGEACDLTTAWMAGRQHAIDWFAPIIEAKDAEIERLRGDLKRAVEERDEALNQLDSAMHSVDVLLNRVAELTGSATVKESLTTEDEKQSHEWKCPIDYPGCRKNCGSYYGCGN